MYCALFLNDDERWEVWEGGFDTLEEADYFAALEAERTGLTEAFSVDIEENWI